jgi:hypothetical protein
MSVNGQREDLHGHKMGSITERFRTPGLVDAAMQKAVRQALRRHKLLGESVAVSDEHGQVKILSPEEIPDYPEEA